MSSSFEYRGKFTKVKTAKRRKISSTMWLERQLNDPFVAKAKMDGYRSRAAYKLLEIHDKFNILKTGINVIDLGAAPGGWCQVAAEITQANIQNAKNRIIAIDLLPIDDIPGVVSIQEDFDSQNTQLSIIKLLNGQLSDLVISDMAANTTGHSQTDHFRIMHLCENAAQFAFKILKPGGNFVAKIFRGGADNDLLSILKYNFKTVKHFKPKSSRKESNELYIVALEKKETI